MPSSPAPPCSPSTAPVQRLGATSSLGGHPTDHSAAPCVPRRPSLYFMLYALSAQLGVAGGGLDGAPFAQFLLRFVAFVRRKRQVVQCRQPASPVVLIVVVVMLVVVIAIVVLAVPASPGGLSLRSHMAAVTSTVAAVEPTVLSLGSRWKWMPSAALPEAQRRPMLLGKQHRTAQRQTPA